MMFDNLLSTALRIVPGQSCQYLKFTGESVNALGYIAKTFADPVTLFPVSVQGVKSELYQSMGLQPGVNHKCFYVSANVVSNNENISNDVIIYNGKRYNIVACKPHYAEDGWNMVIGAEDKDYGVQN